MNDQICDCCEGTKIQTPAHIANRPGLAALAYRVGTHARFLETMKARLAGMIVAAPDPDAAAASTATYPLRELTTRAADDPSIALLDGWATVADVLTFYQERIANEGFLRTATERRSVLELARLVGYALRPGVASTVYLAYTIDANQTTPVEIPIGTRVQSLPGPGELPQSFETSEVLDARAAWNTLKPRLSQPQTRTSILANYRLYLKGIATNLKPNDPLLIVEYGQHVFMRVIDVQPDAINDRTAIILPKLAETEAGPVRATQRTAENGDGGDDELLDVMARLSIPPSVPPANTLRLSRTVQRSFAADADGGLQVVNAVRPDFKATLATALSNVQVTASNPLEVYALRLKTGVYGSTAPLKPITDRLGKVIGLQEWPLNGTQTVGIILEDFDNGPHRAVISVAGAGGTSTKTIRLSSDAPTTQTLDPITFTFDPNNKFATNRDFIVTYEDTGGRESKVQLTYQLQVDGTINVTLIVNDQSAQTIKLTGGQTTIAGVQSHNFKLVYEEGSPPPPESSSFPTALAVTDEAPLPPSPCDVIALDGVYDQIAPTSWYVIARPDGIQKIGQVEDAKTVARADYSFPARVTQLHLDQEWLTNTHLLLSDIRSTTVFAQSEKLELAEEPIVDEICGGKDSALEGTDNEIELDGLYSDLKSGRWLIVTGSRSDIKDTRANVVDDLDTAELVMLAGVRHGYRAELPGDKTHTFITLAEKLAYCYRRDKVSIYGNVVKATHGESRTELLGNGDGSRAFQSFDLRQPPVTYIAAPNPSGVDSTLHVYVNDVEWHEADTLAGLARTDHKFITRTDDADKTSVIFGNGKQGARLPTGAANVRAVYRNGIGNPGNVQAEQINLLVSRPLGVKAVINPLRASGGANRESGDQARKNAPLAVAALDRLVSVQDYADFARTFAGIGKASARRMSQGRRELVHVTIAGADDIPIDPTSDLYRNLVKALRDFGDPDLPIQVDLREMLLVVLSATVFLQADYVWEPVVTKVRTKLLDTFSFDRHELGQDAVLSEAIAAMQAVPGVAYVDVNIFDGIPEMKTDEVTGVRRLLTPKEITQRVAAMTSPPKSRIRVDLADVKDRILPAQLALLSPLVPDTLILNRG